MRRTRGIAAVPALAVIVLAVATASGAGASGSAGWRAKVDSSVLARGASGKTEFLVYLAQADLSGARALRTKEAKGRFVYERLTATARASQGPLKTRLARLGVRYRAFWIVNAIWAVGDLRAVEAMAARPEVAHVYAVGRGRLERSVAIDRSDDSTTRPKRTATVEGSLTSVRAPEVWAMGITGQGVTVASADTGVNWTHPALKPHYRGWDASTSSANHDYNWHDAIDVPNGLCPASSPQPCDDNSHGTHTTGTMVGDDGGLNEIGMAPDAKWIGCRNMAAGVGTVPRYIDCMQWLIAPTPIAGGTGDPSKAPDVVNNSWGCPPSEGCPSQMLKDQLAATRAAGIFYAVSAGNDGPNCSTVQDPLGNYANAFSVGATNHMTDLITDFSSRGPAANDGTPHLKPNVAAPGETIRSSVLGTAYGNKSGTSMASPHVAGLVALIISAKPALAGHVDTIENIIEQSAVDKTPPIPLCGSDLPTSVPNNTYGWGRIDAKVAVDLALATPTKVVVTSFAATRTRTGVSLRWRTVSGAPGLGFDVWRSPTVKGRFTKLTRTLIPARPVPAGATYRYVDRSARPGRAYVYRLDAVDLDGARRVVAVVRVRAH